MFELFSPFQIAPPMIAELLLKVEPITEILV